ncbi:MGMT family protein [Patescibacteria group bacterium]|nr:MGMT family protein [Patescibacteria group bacterium]
MDTTFSQRVLEAALSIPSGRVATYGDIARVSGGSGQAARSVSGILARAHKNGHTNIPWHRIVYSGGRIWTSEHHDNARRKLYEQEGIHVDAQGYIKNFSTIRYSF